MWWKVRVRLNPTLEYLGYLLGIQLQSAAPMAGRISTVWIYLYCSNCPKARAALC